jgi:hypothetical protein
MDEKARFGSYEPYTQPGGTPMRCPIDGTELKMADRQGVEIDYCPQ